jgi:tyrosine-protein phosphatase SIW14
MMMMKHLVVGWFAFCASTGIAFAETSASIPRFREVVPGLYRGGTPGCDGVRELSQMGVRTIVNLDDREAVAREEKACAEALGLHWVNQSMSAVSAVQDSVVNGALAAMIDPQMRPVFVHCQHGQDRTGMLVGIYRVEQQRWTPRMAYREMKDLGFRTFLVYLDRYFKARTHY